jgi:sulfite exporter TauE/SafE
MLLELAPFVALALLGTLHCAGMCGAFAIAASASSSRTWTGTACYVLGKAFTYALLGVLAAGAGGVAVRAGADLTGTRLESARAVLAWIVGLSLCGSGLAALGLIRWPGSLAHKLPAGPVRLFSSVRRLPGISAAFGIGVLTGLLPCGLSWSALLLAAQSRPSTALLGLFAFGLATAPGLVGMAGGWRLAPAALRTRARFVLGPLLVLLGVFTIARANRSVLPGPLTSIAPDCCLDDR